MRALWLRWTWRDFRGRWLQVVATALILSVGIGAFGGVVGLREWREGSTSASLAAMREHDLRVDLAGGSYVDAGRLIGALRDLPPGMITAAEERVVAAGQLDASRAGRSVLVPAQLVGLPPSGAGQAVDRVEALEGRTLQAADREREVAVLDWNFARHFDLPATGAVRVAGLGRLPYVGLGVTPQHLLVVNEAGMSGGESALGILYVPMAVAQRVAGRPGQVNELVLRTRRGTPPEAARSAVQRAFAAALPGVAMTFTRGDEEAAQRILYRDARNDERLFLAIAVLLLAGAAFAAFNLISRVVEAQRREFGVGMALGVQPRMLALRPLALGVQIALLGVAFGIPVGLGLSAWIKDLMAGFFPLPVYVSTFPLELYAIGSVAGVLAPLLAAALPVRRAIGVQPVEAIQVGHRAATGAGATGVIRGLRLPGRSLAQLPLRNLARTPRRTVLTVLGLGAVLAAVVAVLGMVDAIAGTADRQSAELLRSSPDRLEVQLAAPRPAGDEAVADLARVPGVAAAEPGLAVGAQLVAGGRRIDVGLRFVDPRSEVWAPSLAEGRARADGVLIARKAAEDLGLRVGDTVALRHPTRTAEGFSLAEATVPVAGIHGGPVRASAFADQRLAADLGLAGLVSVVTLVPSPRAAAGSIERTLFGRPGIASVRPVSADADALRTTVDEFAGAIRIVAVITLAMALLVAFTSTSVSVDERRREYATMFAFGLPPRSGMRVAMTESVIAGVLGTLVGIATGLVITGWIVGSLLPDVFPDLGATVEVTATTLAITAAVGIGAVALAPLSAYRRMRGMDLPATLRVME